MISGINGRPFVDLSSFVEEKELSQLEEEIFLGLTKSFHVIYSETFSPNAGELAPSYVDSTVQLPFVMEQKLKPRDQEVFQGLNQ